jgi:hypothetical protein
MSNTNTCSFSIDKEAGGNEAFNKTLVGTLGAGTLGAGTYTLTDSYPSAVLGALSGLTFLNRRARKHLPGVAGATGGAILGDATTDSYMGTGAGGALGFLLGNLAKRNKYIKPLAHPGGRDGELNKLEDQIIDIRRNNLGDINSTDVYDKVIKDFVDTGKGTIKSKQYKLDDPSFRFTEETTQSVKNKDKTVQDLTNETYKQVLDLHKAVNSPNPSPSVYNVPPVVLETYNKLKNQNLLDIQQGKKGNTKLPQIENIINRELYRNGDISLRNIPHDPTKGTPSIEFNNTTITDKDIRSIIKDRIENASPIEKLLDKGIKNTAQEFALKRPVTSATLLTSPVTVPYVVNKGSEQVDKVVDAIDKTTRNNVDVKPAIVKNVEAPKTDKPAVGGSSSEGNAPVDNSPKTDTAKIKDKLSNFVGSRGGKAVIGGAGGAGIGYLLHRLLSKKPENKEEESKHKVKSILSTILGGAAGAGLGALMQKKAAENNYSDLLLCEIQKEARSMSINDLEDRILEIEGIQKIASTQKEIRNVIEEAFKQKRV